MRLPTILFLLSIFFIHPVFAETRIVVLGDSLVAGYRLDQKDAFPALLQARIAGSQVVNAGVSGDTTAGGRNRLEPLLTPKPDLLIVELGANDALRGLDPEAAYTNLAAIIERTQKAGVPILLAGMKAPRNLGTDYVTHFDTIYPRLAKRYNVPLYPFFLEGIAMDPQYNLPDGMHPNAAGVRKIVEQIAPMVEKTLQSSAAVSRP